MCLWLSFSQVNCVYNLQVRLYFVGTFIRLSHSIISEREREREREREGGRTWLRVREDLAGSFHVRNFHETSTLVLLCESY